MRTRSSSNPVGESSPNLTTSNPKRHNRRRSKKPFILKESLVDTMPDQRTMAELLHAPTEGYAEAIVVPPILAKHFELKHSLINMMTSNQFFGLKKDNRHDHIRWFNKITSTIKYKDVPNSKIKLMLFPFSLAGATLRWLEKEPPRSILTWKDLVSKFINKLFPPSRTTNLRNEISNFQLWFDESFHEAWDRYKDLLRACPHHGFTEFHQLDTFYNGLNPADQDSLNSAAVATFWKDQTSAVTTAMTAILKQFQATLPPASVKSIEEIYVTCDGAHPYYQCLAFDGNTFSEFRDNIQGYVSAVVVNYNQGSGPLPSNTIANPKEEDECVEETLTDPELGEYTIKVLPPLVQKAKLPSQRNYVEKLLELANTPLNENCSAVILKKLPEKLGDPGKFLILCGFSELKCKALGNLGASINLVPLSVWKKLGLPELISTRITLELANRAICTPAGIARDVFVLVGKFTFPADFVIVDYESDPRVPFILGRPFLRTARALIDIHGEEMILRNGDERLTLNMRHDTSSYSNQPQNESINMINIYNDSYEDYLEDLFATNHLSGNLTFSFHTNLTSPEVINPLRNDDLSFDIEFDLREIKYLLNHDPTKEIDSILEDSINEGNLADPNNDLFDTIPEMFIDEHTLDYLSPLLYDDFEDDLFELESNNDDVYNDPFDSKEDKIKEFKLLIDELDPHRSITVQVTPDKNVKKISISNASLILKDFNPPLSDHELPFHKEVLGSETLLSFSSKNEEKVFKPRILTSKEVHTSLLLELSHRGPKAFKVIKIFESPMEIFPCSYAEDIRILDVSCLHFYPP
uniref:Reverse transcriptase domain-containing protein n=1 Tax=Tanacetum cinerariifolium TaxID=118510 RepID=A0A6L2MNZ4_TANCI|nr:reverse transcriptase domain-containing protein [Tanacetum cinerariifolium]